MDPEPGCSRQHRPLCVMDGTLIAYHYRRRCVLPFGATRGPGESVVLTPTLGRYATRFEASTVSALTFLPAKNSAGVFWPKVLCGRCLLKSSW